jgi:hypothetical protein
MKTACARHFGKLSATPVLRRKGAGEKTAPLITDMLELYFYICVNLVNNSDV